ncbi:hypothetical protein [Corynebacterium halotolerans]|uniref:hypothetical protein n=1 Tax=Corynebacterium halotolerans TaxID=225326 RepID=UPI003CE7A6F1
MIIKARAVKHRKRWEDVTAQVSRYRDGNRPKIKITLSNGTVVELRTPAAIELINQVADKLEGDAA